MGEGQWWSVGGWLGLFLDQQSENEDGEEGGIVVRVRRVCVYGPYVLCVWVG